MSLEDGYYLPGRDLEQQNLGPWELADHMREIAARFRLEPEPEHDSEFPGSLITMCAIGACPGCGRTLISVVHVDANHQLGHCGRCKPFSSEGNVDHAEWLRRRRGLA